MVVTTVNIKWLNETAPLIIMMLYHHLVSSQSPSGTCPPIKMYKLIRLLPLLITQYLLQFLLFHLHHILYAFHFTHDVFQRMTLYARNSSQHLYRCRVLHFWAHGSRAWFAGTTGRPSQDRRQFVRLVVV